MLRYEQFKRACGKFHRVGFPAQFLQKLADQLKSAIRATFGLTLVTGCIFPLLLFVIARPFFPRQTKGSLLMRDGDVVGSKLIGQAFTRPEYFQGRPSAAGSGYDGTTSGGTSLGPNNPKLIDGSADFAGIQQLAEEYRRQNALPPTASIPIDAVTRSGSGLDPHISPENAALQVPRVARARGLHEETVRALVTEHTEGPQLGFLGKARVSVLELNLALDRLNPAARPAKH
jgi:K+-transporting ATPase ATPase C chain